MSDPRTANPGLLERLRERARSYEDHEYRLVQGDTLCGRAADYIEMLERELAELRAADETAARCLPGWHEGYNEGYAAGRGDRPSETTTGGPASEAYSGSSALSDQSRDREPPGPGEVLTSPVSTAVKTSAWLRCPHGKDPDDCMHCADKQPTQK